MTCTTSGLSMSVNENSSAGAKVGEAGKYNGGAAVDADSNPNGYTLSYSLSGTDASKFSIVSSSGQLQIKAGNIPNYESSATSYSVTVTMAASGGSSTGTGNSNLSPNGTGDYIIPVTINVTDANDRRPRRARPRWRPTARYRRPSWPCRGRRRT